MSTPNGDDPSRRQNRPPDDHRPDLVGDGCDPEPLLTAEEVGEILQVPTKSVYELPIQRVRISQARVRWRPEDVRRFVRRRLEAP